MFGTRIFLQIAVVSLLSLPGVTFGDDDGAVAEAAAAVTLAADSAETGPEVIGVTNFNGEPWFGLGDHVVLTVRNVSMLLDHAPAKGAMPVLYINNVPMRGATLFSIDRKLGRLQYELGYDSLLAKSWRLLYRFGSARQMVRVSVGYDGFDICPIAPEAPTVRLIVWHRNISLVALLALIAAIAAFLYMARTTAMIRDGDAQSSYSLGKTQLAWWSFIIICSYVFIGLVTGAFPSLSTNILVLLGISMATTAGAKALDAVPGKAVKPAVPSKMFLHDILSDGTGASIHRFQMFLWTLVFGIYFFGRSLSKLELPTIDDGQLMLMGISSATYLGLRTVENKESPPHGGSGSKPVTSKNEAAGASGESPDPDSAASR